MCKGFRKHIRVWALCLATLFAAYYAMTALFTHVHVVNGVMLVHSHPFSHSHSHSDGQTLALHCSYWEFEEHSINFLGANNEKIYQFTDGSGMRSCQLYYCIR